MNVAEFIPEVSSVEEVYPAASHALQKQRWEHLLARFEEKYGKPAEFISRAPGRVNIIGEHIDYMLFSVLPMATESDLLLAVRVTPENSTIKLANVVSKFPERSFAVPAMGDGDLEIDASQLEWSNYFKAGYRGALEFLRRNGLDNATKPPGMEILVDGNVPSGGGLSSSAAFVCASALAGMVSMGVSTVDKKELVSLAIVSERYVGVNSGGMDQSASVLGLEGSASFISFDPELSAAQIAFPKTNPEPVFLIANTYKTVEKHLTGPIHYNLRVVETTLAAQVLAKKLELGPLPEDAGPLGSTLKGLMDVYFGKNPSEEPLENKLDEISQMAEMILNKDGYTRKEIADILELPEDDLVQKYMTRFPIRADKFQLQLRALHVYKEAARVVKMYKLLAVSSEEENPTEEVLVQIGELMNDSQKSCKELYDCSCDELDELCALARKVGSYGSRLTGAGWGGCSVHLVPADKAEAVKKAWMEKYYGKMELSEEQLREAVVVSKPGAGAVLFRVQPEKL
ncbi:ribosomal protein S5 domain 2-type protein [Pyronema domesticum]|uniref:Galactokinase n=1 Tax=Pyronema omphalodes (strain CBS 100304) TaxID=1076935 RepID=U4L1Z4_PYROM|nr:ribosomal protein S5 domain 2-type protein [Pyronema domesticum]CCX10150.1 Similar to Galactokinase; acc. no. P09608 [Pyronema omphalodes CBS 100304]